MKLSIVSLLPLLLGDATAVLAATDIESDAGAQITFKQSDGDVPQVDHARHEQLSSCVSTLERPQTVAQIFQPVTLQWASDVAACTQRSVHCYLDSVEFTEFFNGCITETAPDGTCEKEEAAKRALYSMASTAVKGALINKAFTMAISAIFPWFRFAKAATGASAYAACKATCAPPVMTCYRTAGYVFGTVPGAGAPAAILVCNSRFGMCSAKCAAKYLL